MENSEAGKSAQSADHAITRRAALKRIAASAAGLTALGGILSCASSGTYSYSPSYSDYSGSRYDNYAHRYIVENTRDLGYTHYGDGHDR